MAKRPYSARKGYDGLGRTRWQPVLNTYGMVAVARCDPYGREWIDWDRPNPNHYMPWLTRTKWGALALARREWRTRARTHFATVEETE